MRYKMSWPAIKACEVGHAGGTREHTVSAATGGHNNLLWLTLCYSIYVVFCFIFALYVFCMDNSSLIQNKWNELQSG